MYVWCCRRVGWTDKLTFFEWSPQTDILSGTHSVIISRGPHLAGQTKEWITDKNLYFSCTTGTTPLDDSRSPEVVACAATLESPVLCSSWFFCGILWQMWILFLVSCPLIRKSIRNLRICFLNFVSSEIPNFIFCWEVYQHLSPIIGWKPILFLIGGLIQNWSHCLGILHSTPS